MTTQIMRNEGFERNPFQDVYLTEALSDPDLFFTWFSPAVITGQTEALFRPGNVVLQGTNGAGKTMLLRLFSPEVQTAYFRHGHKPPLTSAPVMAIGINFVHAGAGSFGARTLQTHPEDNRQMWAAVFGDFLNYYLVSQLIDGLTYLRTGGAAFGQELEAKVGDNNLDQFANILAQDPCWFGSLTAASSFESLRTLVRKRLDGLRAFINWNIDALPEELLRTKTEIGRPLEAAKQSLTLAGVLPESQPLVVTVDQYETLIHIDYELEPDPNKSMGHTLCRVVNSFLAQRKPNISFKVGVRPYSWPRELRLYNSDARLELGRDYQLVNLDLTLARDENRSAWVFPRFAQDVAARRIAFYFNSDSLQYEDWLKSALAKLPPNVELAKYTRNRIEPLVPRSGPWPPEWEASLRAHADSNPYGALLQEVWMMQETDRGELKSSVLKAKSLKPWAREYFRKERKEALLSQIASQTRQRRLYAGWDAILTLSGGNILVFLSLCREMWDLAQRARVTSQRPIQAEFTVERQAQAIWNVAASWLKKQDEFSGGAARRRFVTRLGTALRQAMMLDVKLSNPGRTGFSILDEELEREDATDVRTFLNDAADFGALVRRKHTTKERDRRPRQKWYLFPVLCPNFDLPAIRTKEPYYTSVEEVRQWIYSEGPIALRGTGGNGEDGDDSQGVLFK